MSPELISQNKSFGGWHKRYRHSSEVTHCSMTFAIYLPPQAASAPCPVLYWLSGLTCSDENFMQKSGIQRLAAEYGIIVVAPDTSPRGEQVPADPEGRYHLGLGAGFYVDATRAPWNTHYRMYSYVTEELPQLIAQHFPVNDVCSVAGHSMGGHGALVTGLRNPQKYRSISAFSPVCSVCDSPWGQLAMSEYLGADESHWTQYDAARLLAAASDAIPPVLIDQGLDDEFLEQQLRPSLLPDHGSLTFREHAGYDHSYYFIASFLEEHIRFHAEAMMA